MWQVYQPSLPRPSFGVLGWTYAGKAPDDDADADADDDDDDDFYADDDGDDGDNGQIGRAHV